MKLHDIITVDQVYSFVYEITIMDIGKKFLKYIACPTCGKEETIYISDLLGVILHCDIGKRIYKVNGVYQVENDEQRKRRTRLKLANLGE